MFCDFESNTSRSIMRRNPCEPALVSARLHLSNKFSEPVRLSVFLTCLPICPSVRPSARPPLAALHACVHACKKCPRRPRPAVCCFCVLGNADGPGSAHQCCRDNDRFGEADMPIESSFLTFENDK